jgi:hypothetical protein
MCLTLSPIRGLRSWNWEGDRILHECIVPSGRVAVGYSEARYEYPIDVREFLVAERNEVLRSVLRKDLVAFAEKRGVSADILGSRKPGAFDLRAAMVNAYVSHAVAYRHARTDYWQFPDETLFLKGGDCEDRALLIAALLIASGISSYNVRVALGEVRVQPRRGAARRHDHAWVVYKNESGRWQLLEPLIARRYDTRKRITARISGKVQDVGAVEYVPFYLFNDVHLWQVAHSTKIPTLGTVALRRNWSRLHPEFAGLIHRNILTQALSIPECPDWFRQGLTSHFSTLFGQVIEAQDNFITHGYDCREHFDNGFIEEGWELVGKRLEAFKQDSSGSIDDFAAAAHAIADFYAHTSYAHFADDDTRHIDIYDPTKPLGGLKKAPKYDGGDFDLSGGPFTTGPDWKKGKPAAAAAWEGRIISGRYSQHGDSQSLIERLTPTPETLEPPRDRAALPHHNEIAVDGDKSNNPLYRPMGEYHRQFEIRQAAAVEHIRTAFLANWKG